MRIEKERFSGRVGKSAVIHSQEEAETLGLQALAFLAEDNERIGRFLLLTGADASDLPRLAPEPSFLLAVLDYLASDEPALLEFARKFNIAPDSIQSGRRALGGGDEA